MRIAGIVRDSIVDGEGIRDVIFVQGCAHHCKGCHNQQTWDYGGGEHRFVGELVEELSTSPNNVTISGGEPFDQYVAVFRLVQDLHKQGKSIWIYTGNTLTEPLTRPYVKLAPYVDVIVDGRFVEKLKDPNLLFRGSSNQRLIDLKKSVEEKRIVEYVPMGVE